MKRIISLISIICVSIPIMLNPIDAYAKNLGNVKYTDIAAYINHYAIQSYNYMDKTFVVAEDLRNFGFIVDWNSSERVLNISRDINNNKINQYSIPCEPLKSQLGKNALQIYSTDIRTYVHGVLAESYNIGGKTVILFDSLCAYGPVVYSDDIRAIKLWVEDGLAMRSSMQELEINPMKLSYIAIVKELEEYQKKYDWFYNMYMVYDIDKDGISELLVHVDSTRNTYVFTYNMLNQNAVYLGFISNWYGTYYTDPNENGIISSYMHMGCYMLDRVSINGKNLIENRIVDKEYPGDYPPVSEFVRGATEMDVFELNDFSPINSL